MPDGVSGTVKELINVWTEWGNTQSGGGAQGSMKIHELPEKWRYPEWKKFVQITKRSYFSKADLNQKKTTGSLDQVK